MKLSTRATIAGAITLILAVLLHLHLSVNTAGTMITVSVPWAILAGVVAGLVVITVAVVRELAGFNLVVRNPA